MTFGTVLRTIVGAVFGAIFGYILGLIIELFPGFDQALLNGLHAITGISGLSMPALLAGFGFVAGAALGILASVLIICLWHGVYASSWHKWAHGFGHHVRYSFGHHHRCAMGDHYWSDSCAGFYEPGENSVEDTLQELDGYLSYLEDLPGERLTPFNDKLDRLNDRLGRLRASLHQ